FPMQQAAALSRAQHANQLLAAGKHEEALALAREAVAIDPAEIISQTALGDAASALGQKDEARQAYQAAIDSARRLEPDAQVSYIPDLEKKLRKLNSYPRPPACGQALSCCTRIDGFSSLIRGISHWNSNVAPNAPTS